MNRRYPTLDHSGTSGIFPIMLVVISLFAIVAAFVLANSVQDLSAKTRGFSAIIVVYLLVCFGFHYWGNRKMRSAEAVSELSEADVDERLMAIEAASQYFGGALNSADMFRLVASRANEVVPFTSCALFVIDKSTQSMKIVHAHGENSQKLKDLKVPVATGLAGRSRASGLVQVDRGTLSEEASLPKEALSGFRSSAAIPLMRSGEPFGILQMFSDVRTAFDGNAITILEALGERVTPLILSSLSFERSMSNALTDQVTELPNERAFHLILENQLAESLRNRETRPLTILSMDIKNFDDLNSRYGHAAGDRILGFVARTVKDSLRQMDFLARSNNDEYLAILPTANEDVTEEIVGRINTALFTSRFYINDNEQVNIDLNYGAASFGKHGETAEQLLAAARSNKLQAKADAPRKVIWFPKEMVS